MLNKNKNMNNKNQIYQNVYISMLYKDFKKEKKTLYNDNPLHSLFIDVLN